MCSAFHIPSYEIRCLRNKYSIKNKLCLSFTRFHNKCMREPHQGRHEAVVLIPLFHKFLVVAFSNSWWPRVKRTLGKEKLLKLNYIHNCCTGEAAEIWDTDFWANKTYLHGQISLDILYVSEKKCFILMPFISGCFPKTLKVLALNSCSFWWWIPSYFCYVMG